MTLRSAAFQAAGVSFAKCFSISVARLVVRFVSTSGSTSLDGGLSSHSRSVVFTPSSVSYSVCMFA